jgi:hypothetical protein
MALRDRVRRIALSLPGATEASGRFAFSVENKGKQKGFVWVWLERIDPKKARVPNPAVLAVRVRDQGEKEALLAGDPDKFFTEPHYNGYPAVLVRLEAVSTAELRQLVTEAWRCMAPRELLGEAAATPKARAAATPKARTAAKAKARVVATPKARPATKPKAKAVAKAKSRAATKPARR